jgi:hypothetical protein
MKKKEIANTLKFIIYILVLVNAGYCIYIFNTKNLGDIYDLLIEVSNNAWLLSALWVFNQLLNIDDDKLFPVLEFIANKFLAFFFWLNFFVYTPIKFNLFAAMDTIAQAKLIYYVLSFVLAIILAIKIDVYNPPPLQVLYFKDKVLKKIKDFKNNLFKTLKKKIKKIKKNRFYGIIG